MAAKRRAALHSEFLTPTIESGIENLVPGTQVSIAHSLLVWDNVGHTITLHADDVRADPETGKAAA